MNIPSSNITLSLPTETSVPLVTTKSSGVTTRAAKSQFRALASNDPIVVPAGPNAA